MVAPFVVAQCCWHDIWASVRSLGFLTGVACSFIVLLICWIVEFVRRTRRKNKVLRVAQSDGSELVLTYKAIRTHVRLLLEREFSSLALKGIDIAGGEKKSLRLHVIASEGVKLSEVRPRVCELLSRSFKNDLGLADTIQAISVDVEEFRKAEDETPVAAEKNVPLNQEEPKQELVVPPLPPDVTPLASASQAKDEEGGENKP